MIFSRKPGTFSTTNSPRSHCCPRRAEVGTSSDSSTSSRFSQSSAATSNRSPCTKASATGARPMPRNVTRLSR